MVIWVTYYISDVTGRHMAVAYGNIVRREDYHIIIGNEEERFTVPTSDIISITTNKPSLKNHDTNMHNCIQGKRKSKNRRKKRKQKKFHQRFSYARMWRQNDVEECEK